MLLASKITRFLKSSKNTGFFFFLETLRHGTAAWNCGMELRHGTAAWNCGMELRHEFMPQFLFFPVTVTS
jgi:hypothetical protein